MAYFRRGVNYKITPQDPIKPSDGVNTYSNPFEIRKTECVSALNISNRQYPALSVRPGMTIQYGTGTGGTLTTNAAGTRNGTTFHVQDGTTWKYWNGATFTNVATGLTNATGKILEFNTNSSRYTILTNGTDKKSWDGTGSAVDMTQAPATKYYTVDDYRLYALDGSTIKYSSQGSVSDWTTVDDAGEEVLVGMVGTGTAIAAYNDMVIAWSDQTMHILYGNDPFDYQLMDPIQTGCVSDRSVIIHDGVLYFMDYNRFKAFTGGLPQEISQKVKGYLENINYTYKDKIVTGKWGRYIYLSIPHGSNATSNNLTLEYDTELKNWHPWNIGFSNFFNIGQDLYGISSSGTVYKLQQGTADAGTAITWEYCSGVWEGSPVGQRKVISDIWMVVDLPISSTLTVYYSTNVDNNDWSTLYTFTANSDEQNTRIQVPTTALQNIPWYRLKFSGTGPCKIHYIEPHIRVKTR